MRLQGVAAQLAALEETAAGEAPDPAEDPAGIKLHLVRAWRRQRAIALDAEVARLAAVLSHGQILHAEPAGAQEGQHGVVDTQAEL